MFTVDNKARHINHIKTFLIKNIWFGLQTKLKTSLFCLWHESQHSWGTVVPIRQSLRCHFPLFVSGSHVGKKKFMGNRSMPDLYKAQGSAQSYVKLLSYISWKLFLQKYMSMTRCVYDCFPQPRASLMLCSRKLNVSTVECTVERCTMEHHSKSDLLLVNPGQIHLPWL